jgi:lysozyme
MKYNREEFVKIVAKHEGVVLEPYKDSLGISTIGIGRNLEDRGITDGELMHMNRDLEDVINNGLTEEEAYYLCINDIKNVEKELVAKKPIVLQLDEARQMCLVDMGFNMGVPRLMKFVNMWEAIEKVDFQWAGEEMLDSRWAKQVKGRATHLAEVMRTGEWGE